MHAPVCCSRTMAQQAFSFLLESNISWQEHPNPQHESRFQIDKHFIYRYSVGLLLLEILRRIWDHEVCSCGNQTTQALPWSCGNLHRWDSHSWQKACLNGRSSENCQISRFMYDKVSTMTNKFVKPGVQTYLLPNLHHFLGTFSTREKAPSALDPD